jgi:hypothetical protein
MDWNKLARRAFLVAVVPGGAVLGIYWIAEHHYKKARQPKPQPKPYKDCVCCGECMLMLKHRAIHRWINHLAEEHEISYGDAQETLRWAHGMYETHA